MLWRPSFATCLPVSSPGQCLVARGREGEGVQLLPTMKRLGEEVFFFFCTLYIFYNVTFKKKHFKTKKHFTF